MNFSQMLCNSDSTLNAGKITAVIATTFVAGAVTGVVVGRSIYKRRIAESYIEDFAAGIGRKVEGKKSLDFLESEIKGAPVAAPAPATPAPTTPAPATPAEPAVSGKVTKVTTPAPAAAHVVKQQS